MDAAAGGAVSEPDIPILILGDASHPAIGSIRGESPLLIQGHGAGWVIKFIPADRHLASAGDGMVHNCPIVIGKVPDGKTVHQPVAERIQSLSCAELGNAGATIAAGEGLVRHANGSRRGESSRRRREVQSQLAEVQLAGIVVLPGQLYLRKLTLNFATDRKTTRLN